MKKTALLLIFLVLFSSCTGNLIVGGPSSKKAIGSAPIFNNNIDQAKQQAINNAMHQVIKDSLKEHRNSDTLLIKYNLVEAIVPAKESEMIKDWDLENETEKDGFYFVQIRGRANMDSVIKTISDTFYKYGSPRVAVIVDEVTDTEKTGPFESGTNTIIMSLLKTSGVECIENSHLQKLSEKDKKDLTALVRGNLGIPEAINSELKADVIIAGTVEISDQTEVLKDYKTNMKSKTAIINIRAIDTTTGRILSAASHSAAGVHINSNIAAKKAIETALAHHTLFGQKDHSSNMMTGQFTKNIISSYITTTVNRKIRISALGLDKKEAELFYNNITQNIYGTILVSEVETVNDYFTITLQYAGESKKLAQEIFDKSDSMGYQIKAESIKTDEIIFRVKKR